MPVMIQITGENAGQAIEEFAALSTAFTGAVNTVTAAAPVQEEKPKRQRTTKTEPKPESTKETESVEKTKDKSTAEVTGEGTGEDIPTFEDLRAVGKEKGATSDGKAAIRALLDEFESKSLSEVPEEKRAAFLERLKAL
ncbi:hypothetical protein M5X00_04880 [Paenibacillus alvei]|uniref:hypothetical protein n=1 Tax=Paenibacillus alvei TaxID=44250 RepID=UPI0021CFA66E|nr:hypothetical protein [Paenibacillus alvei]MCY9539086.1 hypothetical protein [Paenibacillus alvei]MCY9707989.1 hypothetical protein [Paenibacillus alvei]MCY9734416.1 hypothetical protein [Paenibacillus alvei]MCY9753594.1 hypothetical protein [Paenibacillus alvei]MEC0078742.1 hypothetical protein [Paenibacillus alvei]